MLLVNMSGNNRFIAFELLGSKPNRYLMCLFGCDIFVWMERLYQMIEHSSVGFSVPDFGIHHFIERRISNTVYTAYKFSVVKKYFLILHTVFQKCRQTVSCLHFFTCNKFYCRYDFHLFRSSSSVSCSFIFAYSSVIFSRLTNFTFPMLQSVAS